MSASQLPAIQATSLQVVDALQHYEEHVRQLAARWLDMDLYLKVSAEIDCIKVSCSLITGLATPLTIVLISHTELVHCLWRSAQGPRPDATAQVDERLREHLEALHRLSRRCLHVAGHSADLR